MAVNLFADVYLPVNSQHLLGANMRNNDRWCWFLQTQTQLSEKLNHGALLQITQPRHPTHLKLHQLLLSPKDGSACHPHGDGVGVGGPIFQVAGLPGWQVLFLTQPAHQAGGGRG